MKVTGLEHHHVKGKAPGVSFQVPGDCGLNATQWSRAGPTAQIARGTAHTTKTHPGLGEAGKLAVGMGCWQFGGVAGKSGTGSRVAVGGLRMGGVDLNGSHVCQNLIPFLPGLGDPRICAR